MPWLAAQRTATWTWSADSARTAAHGIPASGSRAQSWRYFSSASGVVATTPSRQGGDELGDGSAAIGHVAILGSAPGTRADLSEVPGRMGPMATIVFLHAHPDDEASGTSGTMTRLSREGHRVVVAYGTGGELAPRPRTSPRA